MGDPVVHWEIMGKDAPKLHKFYSDLFGWSIKADNPMGYGLIAGPDAGGVGGGIGSGDGTTYVTIYVKVNDLQAYLGKVERLGGKTVVPPTEIPGMVTFALFSDPDGNHVGLIKG
jgi:predicted enzyme related to lactoylglutathione lyase